MRKHQAVGEMKDPFLRQDKSRKGGRQWIRRWLRAIAWKQWKRGSTRFAEL